MRSPSQPPGRRTTIVTLSQEAGVAPSTISRALKGDTRISAEMRAKIARLAKQHGYTDMQAHLRVVADEPVLQVDRLRHHQGRPVLHKTAHVPAWVGTRLALETLSARTMLEALAQSGIQFAAARQEMHAAPCPEAVAPLIGLEPGDPVRHRTIGQR